MLIFQYRSFVILSIVILMVFNIIGYWYSIYRPSPSCRHSILHGKYFQIASLIISHWKDMNISRHVNLSIEPPIYHVYVKICYFNKAEMENIRLVETTSLVKVINFIQGQKQKLDNLLHRWGGGIPHVQNAITYNDNCIR